MQKIKHYVKYFIICLIFVKIFYIFVQNHYIWKHNIFFYLSNRDQVTKH